MFSIDQENNPVFSLVAELGDITRTEGWRDGGLGVVTRPASVLGWPLPVASPARQGSGAEFAESRRQSRGTGRPPGGCEPELPSLGHWSPERLVEEGAGSRSRRRAQLDKGAGAATPRCLRLTGPQRRSRRWPSGERGWECDRDRAEWHWLKPLQPGLCQREGTASVDRPCV